MNWKAKLLGLSVVLGLSSAHAATLAGTVITNQASATYIVGGQQLTSNSAVVTATVQAVPSYTITPNGSESAPAYTTAVNAGGNFSHDYTIENTGNTYIQVNLGATYGTGSSAVSAVKLNGQEISTVAGDPTGKPSSTPSSLATTATIAPGDKLTLNETYTAPNTPGDYFTSPVGVSINYATDATTTPVKLDVTNSKILGPDFDNVNKVTVTSNVPIIAGGPNNPAISGPSSSTPLDPNANALPHDGLTNTTVPTPANNTNTGTTPLGNDPSKSTTPTGYTNSTGGPGNTPLPVAVNGDTQYAFPKDPNNAPGTPDQATMVGTVGNPNSTPQTYNLTPGSGYTCSASTGTWTNTANNTTVQFKDASGNLLGCAADGSGSPLTVPAGSTANYQVEISYPDPVNGSTATPIDVPVMVNGAGPQNYTILPPDVMFGNANGAPSPSDATTAATSVLLTQPSVETCMVYPMDIFNTGQYAESYALSTPTTNPALPSNATVKYVSNLPTSKNTAGIISSTDCATLDNTSITNTPVIKPGDKTTVYAVIKAPAGTPAGIYTLKQQVTGNYSGIQKALNTDTLVVSAAQGSGVVVTQKLLNSDTPNPGDTITYTITATNNYTSAINDFILRNPSVSGGTLAPGSAAYAASNLFGNVNLTYKAVEAQMNGVTGTLLYSTDGSTWTSTAPTIDATTTALYVGVDTNGDNKMDVNDTFPAGASITLTIPAIVK